MFNRFLLILLASVAFEAASQTNFPYAKAGLGDKLTSNHSVFSGMGNNFVTYTSPSVLNTNNPASYSYLRHQFPIFALGLSTRLSFNEANGAKEFNGTTNISEFAFGLSFAKRFGLAAGLKPFQKKSYSFVDQQPLMSDSVRYDYIGGGNLNKLFVGFSFNILNYDSLKWTIGGNVGMIFGQINDERRSYLLGTTSAAGGVETTTHNVRSFQYDLGTVFNYRMKNGHTLTVGGTFEPLQNITSVYNKQLAYSLTDVTNPNTYQVVEKTGNVRGKIAYASTYNAGVSYSKTFKTARKDGNTRNTNLTVSASYSSTNWSKYKESYGDTTFSYGLKNSSGLQIGLQYIPEIQYVGNVLPKFFERVNYRVGFYRNQLPFSYNNKQLTEWAGTVGFGMPIIVDKRLDSSLQLGVAVGKRGTNQAGSFNETFVAVNIGVLIAPSINDRWFVKRKLD